MDPVSASAVVAVVAPVVPAAASDPVGVVVPVAQVDLAQVALAPAVAAY